MQVAGSFQQFMDKLRIILGIYPGNADPHINFSGGQIFISGLVASALSAVYADFLAARKRAPVPLFLIPSVVPLIPGSTLYYTMSAAVQGNTEEVSHYGSLTLQYALSIAGGICIVWTILLIF